MAKRKKSSEAWLASCSKRKNGKKGLMKDPVPYLSREIISNILHRLPVECLYDSGRYVCKSWAELLHTPSFIQSHLRNSVVGFITFNKSRKSSTVWNISIEEWKLEKTDVFPEFDPFRDEICGSTDGVLLINRDGVPHVANPIARKMLKLPCFPCQRYWLHGIGSVPPNGVLKVVSTVRMLDGAVILHVLTLGHKNMAWRKLNFASSECELKSFVYYENSLAVDGVIYIMVATTVALTAHYPILAVDLRDESTNYLKAPLNIYSENTTQYSCLAGWRVVQMGNTICCVHPVYRDGVMRVLMLKDLYKNEWVKHKTINLFEHPDSKFLPPRPLRLYLWLEAQHVMFFGWFNTNTELHKHTLIAFCLKTGKLLVVNEFFHFPVTFQHTPSLVWF